MMARRTRAVKRLSAAEILGAVGFTEKLDRLNLAQLPAQARAHIVAAKLSGYKPILMYWPDGKQAHALIPEGDSIPPVDVVIKAYHACEAAKGKAATNAAGEWV